MVRNSDDMPDQFLDNDEIAFDYIKADNFRSIWSDGVIGNVTPRGYIHFAPYVERNSIPRRVVHQIDKVSEHEGKLAAEVLSKRLSRDSVVREMQFDVMMTVDEAESLAMWLLTRVTEARGNSE